MDDHHPALQRGKSPTQFSTDYVRSRDERGRFAPRAEHPVESEFQRRLALQQAYENGRSSVNGLAALVIGAVGGACTLAALEIVVKVLS